MNNRRPIIVMLAFGILIIAALSFYPYSLTFLSQAKQEIADSVVTPQVSAIAAPPPAVREPEFDAALWYAGRGEPPETHGVLIETFDQQRLLASHNADETFNPASLMKLATSLVILKKLGPDYRFQTRVYTDGHVDKSGTLRGQLYVIGADPTFGDVAANMIGEGLRARGIKRVTEAVNVSPDFCFNYRESPEESAARLVKGLRLGNPKAVVASEPPQGELLFVFSSYPLREVLLYMNAHSNNFVAEKLGALIGGPEGLRQFLIDQLQLPADKVSIEKTSGRQHNRMTPRGVLAVIRELAEEAKRQGLEPADIMPVARDDYGTLRRRLIGTGLEGALVGKTGTLTTDIDGGMAALGGIIYTQEAGMILFVIMDQGNRIGENRQMEDEMLAEVVAARATPLPVTEPTPRRLLPSAYLRIEESASSRPHSVSE